MTNQEIDKLIARLPELFFGKVGKDGYYPLGSTELIKTDRVAGLKIAGLEVGEFIDKDFNVITHQRVANFLNITL